MTDGFPPPEGNRYWAFISYSQRDASSARKLRAFLESYRVPRPLVGRAVGDSRIPRRAAPVFRDRDELPGSPDLGATLHEALAASWSLIVICSPHSAVSPWVEKEICSFKALGRADRVFPLILAGEPDAAEHGFPAASECFPRPVRFAVSPGGEIVADQRCEPLAADARPGKDGWDDACLKLLAGVLGLGFDDLRRRERTRRRRRAISALASVAAILLAFVGAYVALSDAEIALPGSDAIRREIDHHGLALFRPAPAPEQIARAAAALRAPLRRRLLQVVSSGQLEREEPVSAWSIGQVAAALYRDPAATEKDLSRVVSLLDALYVAKDGDKVGERLVLTHDDVGVSGRVEPIFWTVMALSSALRRPDAISPEVRTRFLEFLSIAQRLAEPYYPLADGGWNTAARQVDPGRHFVYTTALALHVLLETRAAGLGWRGDRERLERMISDTGSWLIGAFSNVDGYAGWSRSLDDDRGPDSGITLLVYSALGRACAQSELPIPKVIEDSAFRAQAALRTRSYEAADPDIRFDIRVAGSTGAPATQVTTIRMIWFPWAVESVTHWSACARKHDAPREVGVALDRTLAHLLITLSPSVLNDVLRSPKPVFVAAETDYGLGSVR